MENTRMYWTLGLAKLVADNCGGLHEPSEPGVGIERWSASTSCPASKSSLLLGRATRIAVHGMVVYSLNPSDTYWYGQPAASRSEDDPHGSPCQSHTRST
jgi:hypothetical protein